MEIKSKIIFKIEIKKKIDKFKKEFPFYFYFNIFINVLLLTFSAVLMVFSILLNPGIILYTIIPIIVMRITLRSFLRNVKIIKDIHAGRYDFGIKDHEMENVIEFIEDLPIKKEEVEKMRVSLSYNKIIDVLEASGIIVLEKEIYDINLAFKYRTEKAMDPKNH